MPNSHTEEAVELVDEAASAPKTVTRGRAPCCRGPNLLLALTVVVIIILILVLPVQTALFGMGVILGWLLAGGAETPQGRREGFAGFPRDERVPPPYRPLAGSPEMYGPADQPAPYAVFSETGRPRETLANASGSAGRLRYPGAIEVDDEDTEADAGHVDRSRYEEPAEGNPYDPMRVRADLASGPCVDDEANDNEIDGDEKMALQGYSRNDATRVTAGTINRRSKLDPYLREEVMEAEDREWWGRHEL